MEKIKGSNFTKEYLDAISETMGGAFYLFDEKVFEENYIVFRNALQKAYKRSQVAYALKANYMPAVLRVLKKNHGFAEVVSKLEYDIAKLFIDGTKITLNGPANSEEHIRKALSEGATVNIDSWYQIEKIKKISFFEKSMEIGLRYNSSEVFPNCRFGFNYENGDLFRAIKEINKLGNVNIASLHSHYSSPEKTLEFFQRRAKKSVELHSALSLNSLKVINLGGGFMGRLPQAVKHHFGNLNYQYKDYANIIGEVFQEAYGDHGPTLMIEPGVSLVGESMKLIAKVLEIKNMHGHCYAVIDTNVNTLNPTRSKAPVSCSAISYSTGPQKSYTLVGNTCMETDVLVENFSGSLTEGDYIVFDNRGAYSNNFTPAFIMPQPGIASVDGHVIKRPDDLESVLQTYVYQ